LKEEKHDLIGQKKFQLKMAEVQLHLFWESIAVLLDEKHDFMLPKFPLSES